MPKGFPIDRMQNLPPLLGGAGSGGPRGPFGGGEAYNALLDEFKIPVSPTVQPLRGARILSADLIKPGMGRPDGCAPNCTLAQEFGVPFSRVSLWVMSLASGSPNATTPPPFFFQVFMSVGCVRTLAFSGRYDPQSFDDGDLLLQWSGLIGTELQVWGRLDPVISPTATPYRMALAAVIDRVDQGERKLWLGPNTT